MLIGDEFKHDAKKACHHDGRLERVSLSAITKCAFLPSAAQLACLLLPLPMIAACSMQPVTQSERLKIRQDMERLHIQELQREQIKYYRRKTDR